MKTVYLVTSGDYSDYHFLCAFERKEDAIEYVNQLQQAQNSAHEKKWGDPFADDYLIETCQLWDSVPVVKVDELGYVDYDSDREHIELRWPDDEPEE